MIEFALADTYTLLLQTPSSLAATLSGLPQAWPQAKDGPDSWSAHEVVAHLLDGERVDWLPRLQIILQYGEDRPFHPFDREDFREACKGHSTAELVDQFAALRKQNVAELCRINLSQSDLERTGVHPEFGVVTVRQLLATWVTHDHGHLVQIHRTIARQYADDIGPWRAYLSVIAA